MNARASQPLTDEVVVRRLSQAVERMRPDPLFERRLRGETLNRHVAIREGSLRPGRDRTRQMGILGRAVLYATFALAVGTTAAGAAAQGALPGDLLYPLKLRIEEVRLQVAPAWARPRLAAEQLDARLAELEILAARGDWSGVVATAPRVDVAAMHLEAFGLGIQTPGQDEVERRTEVLSQIAANAPPAAQQGLARAIAASTAATGRDAEDEARHRAHPTSPAQQPSHSPHPH